MKEIFNNTSTQEHTLKKIYNKFKGYGYYPNDPIEIPTPLEVMNFFNNHEICRENISGLTLLGYNRIGSVDSARYTGPVDKYKVAYLYFENNQPVIEAFDMYFCFYKKVNQTWRDHIKNTLTGEQNIPEHFKKRIKAAQA